MKCISSLIRVHPRPSAVPPSSALSVLICVRLWLTLRLNASTDDCGGRRCRRGGDDAVADGGQQVAGVPVGLEEVSAEAHLSGGLDFRTLVEGGHEDDGDVLPAGVVAEAAEDV